MSKNTRPPILAPAAIAAALLFLGGNSSAETIDGGLNAVGAGVVTPVSGGQNTIHVAGAGAATDGTSNTSVGSLVGTNAAIQQSACQTRRYVSSSITVEALPRFIKDLEGSGMALVARVELKESSFYTLYTETL